MENISEIYERYEVMPQLRDHQLRVAAVASRTIDAFEGSLDGEVIVNACLIHDMGNILKFDLSYFPEFVEPQGLAYWEEVKRRTAERYQTNDENVATRKIAEELGLSKAILDCLEGIGFSRIERVLDDPSFGKKICCYADQRVGPLGVVTIEERLTEGKKRYERHPDSLDHAARLADGLRALERQLFAQVRITPADISDASIAQYWGSLVEREL